jgi:hypothetical protein
MQVEQSTTTQVKKSVAKKGGKNAKVSQSEETEQVSAPVEVQQPIQVSAPVEVKQPIQVSASVEVQQPTQVSAPVETPEVEQQLTETEVVVQEYDINSVLEFMDLTSNKFIELSKFFKDNVVSKEERNKLETSYKKFNKSYSQFQGAWPEYLSRQVSILEKNVGNKSGGQKKVTDKEKSAIHKKLQVHPFLLDFMKLPQGTLVSRSDALTAITGFVKDAKVGNPDIIVADDKKTFKIIGELQTLFKGIEKVMISRNALEGQMPTQIKYTQIMQYMTHCFVKNDEATVV